MNANESVVVMDDVDVDSETFVPSVTEFAERDIARVINGVMIGTRGTCVRRAGRHRIPREHHRFNDVDMAEVIASFPTAAEAVRARNAAEDGGDYWKEVTGPGGIGTMVVITRKGIRLAMGQ